MVFADVRQKAADFELHKKVGKLATLIPLKQLIKKFEPETILTRLQKT